MAFFTFPLWLHYITSGYLFERLQETRGYSLKEHETTFLKRQNLIFFFLQQLEVFHLFLAFCYLLGRRGGGFGAVNLDTPLRC